MPALPIPLRPEPSPGAAPAVQRRAGTLTGVRALSPALVELVVTLTRPLAHRPGQAVALALAGRPARTVHPTLRLEASTELNELVVHWPRDPLAEALAPGHLARVRGPLADDGYRPGEGRLVLVADGLGVAPVWAIARAACCTEPGRALVVVVAAPGAAEPSLRPALDWLAGAGARVVTACGGPATAHLPRLGPDDTVHAAGPAAMVAAAARLARAVGATFRASVTSGLEPETATVVPLTTRRRA